ncbi:hypothetical protein V8D89_007777 [Ganoderma adspersum]
MVSNDNTLSTIPLVFLALLSVTMHRLLGSPSQSTTYNIHPWLCGMANAIMFNNGTSWQRRSCSTGPVAARLPHLV